jgi:hypothetical protein
MERREFFAGAAAGVGLPLAGSAYGGVRVERFKTGIRVSWAEGGHIEDCKLIYNSTGSRSQTGPAACSSRTATSATTAPR